MNKLVKQSLGYFKQNKANVAILCLLTFLTSFMYYFVECSIDKNLSMLRSKSTLTEGEKDFMVGLQSNTVLALVFLICLIVITGFIFYMFYKKKFELTKKNIGCYRALGFTNFQISKIYMSITFGIGIIFSFIGFVVGYYFSYVLLNNYLITYDIASATRGVSIKSLIFGIIGVPVVMCICTYLAYRKYKREEISTLINEQSKEMTNSTINKIAEKVSKLIVSKYSFSSRLALRKPFNLLLVLISVYVFLVLMVLSISLNLSSGSILESQKSNREFQYAVSFESNETQQQSVYMEYYQKEKVEVLYGKMDVGEQELYAIDNDGTLFRLMHGQEQIHLEKDEIAISKRMEEVFAMKKGDTVSLDFNGNKYNFVVKTVADNGNVRAVYVNRNAWNEIVGNDAASYNGGWTSEKDNQWKNASVKSFEEYVKELENENVSNRASAIINQVLGCVFGILLIFLVLLLNFQDNTQNFIYLRKMGYLLKEIKIMLVNIYFPILIIAYVISLAPSIFTCKKILKILSLGTGDYMPFITHGFVFVYALAVLFISYECVLKLFDVKLRKMLRKIDNGDI